MTHSKQAEQAKQNHASVANRTYSASKVAQSRRILIDVVALRRLRQ
jgi:hypothetical protein